MDKRALGWDDFKLKVARIGDNMREVAVTEGVKSNPKFVLEFRLTDMILQIYQTYRESYRPQLNDLLAVYESSYTLTDA